MYLNRKLFNKIDEKNFQVFLEDVRVIQVINPSTVKEYSFAHI